MEFRGAEWAGDFDVSGMKEETTDSTMSATIEDSGRHHSPASERHDLSSQMGKSQTSPGESQRSGRSDKSKKKKKHKGKDKKSSNSPKKDIDASEHSDRSRELFSKMLDDAYGSGFTQQFGDFEDIDPREEEASGKWSRSQDGDRSRSTSRSQRSTSTPMTRASGDESALTGIAVTPRDRSSDLAEQFCIEEDDPFADVEKFQNDIDCLSDEDSVSSDITGLTGMFSSIDQDDDSQEEHQAYQSNGVVYPQSQAPNGRAPIPSSFQSRQQQQRPPKQLRFSTITIREYQRILTLNPSTIQGPSIGLGWKYLDYGIKSLDGYEQTRGARRKASALVMNRPAREALLLSLGYSKKDLANAMRLLTKYRNQRRQTVQNLKAEKVEEKLEGAKQRVKGLFRGKKK